MQASRHWLIGSGLGALVVATLAVFTDAALPPAAPRPAPVPGAPLAPGAISPFASPALSSPDRPAAPEAAALPPAPAHLAAGRSGVPSLAPDTAELQALLDELVSRPSVDAALDRELRDSLLADVRQRLAHLRGTGGETTEIAQLERMASRLTRIP